MKTHKSGRLWSSCRRGESRATLGLASSFTARTLWGNDSRQLCYFSTSANKEIGSGSPIWSSSRRSTSLLPSTQPLWKTVRELMLPINEISKGQFINYHSGYSLKSGNINTKFFLQNRQDLWGASQRSAARIWARSNERIGTIFDCNSFANLNCASLKSKIS